VILLTIIIIIPKPIRDTCQKSRKLYILISNEGTKTV
jgi:hypothetical protein